MARDLRTMGYRAIDVAGCVRVELPWKCRVTVEPAADGFRCSSQFGALPRATALGMAWGPFTVLLALLVLASGRTRDVAIFAAGLVVCLAFDIYRYRVTEVGLRAVRSLIGARYPQSCGSP